MQPVSRQKDDTGSRLLKLGLGLVLLIVVAMALIMVLGQIPPWPDFQIYYGVGERWVNGQTQLYDEFSRGFYNAPWTLLLIAPLSQLPLNIALGTLATVSIVCLVVSLWLLADMRPTPFMLLQLASMPAIYLIINGQLDSISLLGVSVAYWSHRRQKPLWLGIAFVLILVKPTNLILAGTVLLLGMHSWRWQDIAKAVGIPLVFVIGSGFVIGFDWMIRYVENYGALSLLDNGTSTLWKWLDSFGVDARLALIPLIIVLVLLLWRHTIKNGFSYWGLATAIATQFIFTPYAWIYHYVLLLPAQVYLTRRHWLLGLLVYALTWQPAVRYATGGRVYHTSDVVIPLTIGLICWGLYFTGRQANDDAQIDEADVK